LIVAGIDPGINKTGIGIVEIKGNNICYVDQLFNKNTIATKNTLDKLAFIYNEITNYLKNFEVITAAIEDIFYAKI